jgi:hypothetical protein
MKLYLFIGLTRDSRVYADLISPQNYEATRYSSENIAESENLPGISSHVGRLVKTVIRVCATLRIDRKLFALGCAFLFVDPSRRYLLLISRLDLERLNINYNKL